MGTRSLSLLNPIPFPVAREGSLKCLSARLGVDSGREFSGRGTMRAWRIAGGRVMGGKVISSCRLCERAGDGIEQ
jgi:hypothetical protein